MKIQQINQTLFGAKDRFLNSRQLHNIKIILTRMNSETVYKSDKMVFSSTITNRLSHGKTQFTDTRLFFDKVPDKKQMSGVSLLAIGKTMLVIDNETGKITDWKKPALKCWHRILNDVDKTLDFFNKEYFNTCLVKKHRFSIAGFTQKGADKINNIKGKINV